MLYKRAIAFLLAVSVVCILSCNSEGPAGPANNGESSGSWIVSGNTLTDPDKHVYTTVTIGTQVWTVQNLKTTKYSDGSAIPIVTENEAWMELSTPAYCWYDNDEAANKTTYGALYNWFVVSPTNPKTIAPAGWRVPMDEDWWILSDYLGGLNLSAGMMKEAGTTNWNTPNTNATNVSGFSALPGGYRSTNGFSRRSFEGHWWSATDYNIHEANSRSTYYNNGILGKYSDVKSIGISVRLDRNH